MYVCMRMRGVLGDKECVEIALVDILSLTPDSGNGKLSHYLT